MPSSSIVTNDPLFRPLCDCVASGSCVAIIGAGMSSGDYPLWDKLVALMEERCSLRPDDETGSNALDIAEAAKRKSPTEYFKVLNEQFDRRSQLSTARRYHMLARIRFESYVTLNFDPLLLDVLDLHDDIKFSEYPNLNPEHLKNREIFYIHGRIAPGTPADQCSIVLTRSEFDDAYNPMRNSLFSFLQTLLLNHHVCFLGCNPTQEYMASILEVCKTISDRVHDMRSSTKPEWYMLLDADSPEIDFTGAGINVVRYPKVDDRYIGFDQILEMWAKKNEPVLRPGGLESLYNPDGGVRP